MDGSNQQRQPCSGPETGAKERIYQGARDCGGADGSQARGGRRAAAPGFKPPGGLEDLKVLEATCTARGRIAGRKLDDPGRLEELEAERAKLKPIVADQVLAIGDCQGLRKRKGLSPVRRRLPFSRSG